MFDAPLVHATVLKKEPTPAQSVSRRKRIVLIWSICSLYFFFILFIGMGYGDWDQYNFLLIILGIGLGILLLWHAWKFLRVFIQRQREDASQLSFISSQAVSEIMDRALDHPTDTILPIDEEQPSRLSSEEMPSPPEKYLSGLFLSNMPSSQSPPSTTLAAFLVFFSGWSLMNTDFQHALPLTYYQYYSFFVHNIWTSVLLDLFICLAPFFGIFYLLFASYPGFFLRGRVYVSQERIRWRRSFQWHGMLWSDVRAIIFFQQPGDSHWFFAISTENTKIAWKWSENPAWMNESASEYLLRLAVTTTGLPVRDASSLINSLAIHTGKATTARQRKSIQLPESSWNECVASYPTESALIAKRPFSRFSGAIMLGLCFIMALLYGIEDIWQPNYIADLPPRIIATSPLFYQSLQQPSTRWILSEKNSELAYDPAGITITQRSKENYTTLLLPAIYNATAIQVTVTAPSGEMLTEEGGTAAGIVVRDDSHYDPCQFLIDGSGHPTFDCGVWRGFVQFDRKFPPGIPVTLFLVARGSYFLCYANGEYLGSYFNNEIVGAGRAGVEVIGTGTTATFHNLSIWQLTQPPLPWYI
jgi:hypothetical protein